MNVWVLDHAADRFAERVRPGLSRREASIELARLLREFGRVVEPPGWCPELRGCAFALEVSDGVLAICTPANGRHRWPQAVTVVVRSSRSPEARVRRNHRGSVRRAARRSRRRGLPGRREVVIDEEV